MPITGLRAPGARAVRLDLDPRTALDLFFALAASLHTEETTTQMRLSVAGLLPQFKRALVTTGVVSAQLLRDYERQLATKPAPPALDVVAARLQRPV